MAGIHHAVWIAAPAADVYHALTDQKGLAAWWTPHATGDSYVDADLKFPFGENYFKEMKIISLLSDEYVEWYCTAGADEWIGTTLTFALRSGAKENMSASHPEMSDQLQQSVPQHGTLLTFHHANWRDQSPMYAECNYTWGRFLRSLKLYCETGTGTPWPSQHQV